MHVPETHRDLIEGPYPLVLSTIDADGRPHIAPVWCKREGDDLMLIVMRGSDQEASMKRNPRVSLLAYDRENPLHNMEIRGNVIEMTSEGASELLDLITESYVHEPEAAFLGDHAPAELQGTRIPVCVRIAPTRIRVEG